MKIWSGSMYYVFNKSSIGYSHILNKKPCQDFSSSYSDPYKTIITCSDGHGGEVYIRSHIGANIASSAVINVFSRISLRELRRTNKEELERMIKINVLCEYNRMVESSLVKDKLKRSEVAHLDEDQIFLLKDNPSRAFGTTLTGAMVYENKLVLVGIGDSEVLLIRKGEMIKAFDDEDEPVANITHSMCQDDAFTHLNVKILDWRDYDGVILCTDGLSSPYQSYTNLNNSFIKPLVYKVVNTRSTASIDSFIDELAGKLGIGDDVSLSFIIKGTTNSRYYKK